MHIYLPEALARLRNGGEWRAYPDFPKRRFIAERVAGGFTILHEMAPSAHEWLERHLDVWQK